MCRHLHEQWKLLLIHLKCLLEADVWRRDQPEEKLAVFVCKKPIFMCETPCVLQGSIPSLLHRPSLCLSIWWRCPMCLHVSPHFLHAVHWLSLCWKVLYELRWLFTIPSGKSWQSKSSSLENPSISIPLCEHLKSPLFKFLWYFILIVFMQLVSLMVFGVGYWQL